MSEQFVLAAGRGSGTLNGVGLSCGCLLWKLVPRVTRENDRGEVPGGGKSPGEVTGVTVTRQRALASTLLLIEPL